MRANRFLKYINTTIALALLAVLAAIYWFAWRSQPVTSGTLTAPLLAPARIVRGPQGYLHIYAENLEDALFLQGYACAQDRLWQMDLIRRAAAGELAEILGPALLESDRNARNMRLRRLAEDSVDQLPPDQRAALAAYARGVNFFLASQHSPFPLEFTLLRYHPRPWRIADSLLAGLSIYRTLSTSWQAEVQKQSLLDAGKPALVEQLFALNSGPDAAPGSNAWVVSGTHTSSGRPLLANDMHLQLQMPGVFYHAHLKCPSLNVTGVALPGLPGIIAGHNERIAWGITSLQADVQDLLLEDLDSRTGRYTLRGAPAQAQLETDLIRVKDAPPTELRQWVTANGPVFFRFRGRNVSLRWMAHEPGGLSFPLLDWNRAQNWQQFRAALSQLGGPALNFVYADIDGNIGYQVAGRLPIRAGYRGDVPVEAFNRPDTWTGHIPFDKLPSLYNPSHGIIVTANQNPFPPDYPFPVNGYFAPPYRARQIRRLLETGQFTRPAAMLKIQMDVYSENLHFLARELAAAYARSGEREPSFRQPIALLRAWNGQMDQKLAAPMLASLLLDHLRKRIGDLAAPAKGESYRYSMSTFLIARLLRERPPEWQTDFDRLLLQSLNDALEEGIRMQGRDVSRWRYGAYNQLLISHPVGGRFPVLHLRFNVGPLRMSGSPDTVKAVSRSHGPSMRMVADLSDWDQSLLILPAGQSGHVLSRHYKDQWKAWYYGTGLPMQFEKYRPEAELRFTPEP